MEVGSHFRGAPTLPHLMLSCPLSYFLQKPMESACPERSLDLSACLLGAAPSSKFTVHINPQLSPPLATLSWGNPSGFTFSISNQPFLCAFSLSFWVSVFFIGTEGRKENGQRNGKSIVANYIYSYVPTLLSCKWHSPADK